MAKIGHTVAEKLVLAAAEIESSGKSPFTAEDLVVSAWTMFPDAFGLKGYEHPDSNRVYAEIMGSKPIRKRGYLQKTGEKRYCLTDSGRQLASQLKGLATPREAEKAALAREVIDHIKSLLKSKAFTKHIKNSDADLTFLDACTFWSITPRSSAIQLDGKQADLEHNLELVLQLARKGPLTAEHGGRPFAEFEIEKLRETHQVLKGKFADDLILIRKRTDERKTIKNRKR